MSLPAAETGEWGGWDMPSFEGLDRSEQLKAAALLRRCHSLFAKDEADLECSSLIQHEIPLLDDTPVCQRYRHILPSQYDSMTW